MTESYFGSALRRRIIFLTIVGMVTIQIFQLVNMQLLDTNKYEEKSKDNSIKTNILSSPRGIIFDRNINVLVGNKPSFTIQLIPSEYDTSNSEILESVLGLERGYIKRFIKKYRMYSKYLPRVLMKGVSYKIVSWVDENNLKLSGVSYFVDTKRDYSFGVSGSHIFGYTKQIDRETLKKNRDIYSIGDEIGFSGIEREYEKYLRGTKGKEYLVVNSRQRVVSRLNEGKNDLPPIKGNDLVLSLDKHTQIVTEQLMSNYSGTAIAVDPTNGEILSFVSAPQYDLSFFAGVTSNSIWDSLVSDKSKPLFNRGTISMYPPGSTFKMIVAAAAIDEGIIAPSYSVFCDGGLQFGDRFFKCTHHHGKVNLNRAIERSCNTYFYKLILKVGIDNLTKYIKKFHFGEKTGIDISPESEGLVPSRDYYNRVYGKGKWSKGNLLNLSIGQGEILTTPIQLAQYTSLIANSGITKTPHFAKGYIKTTSNEFIAFKYDSVKVDVSKKSFKIIKKAMKDVVNDKDGTGFGIKLKEISISGKTGTAQNSHGKDHSIFIAYAPSDNPKIAVAVIVENVGFGSTFAAPIAKEMITTYLGNINDAKFDIINFEK